MKRVLISVEWNENCAYSERSAIFRVDEENIVAVDVNKS